MSSAISSTFSDGLRLLEAMRHTAAPRTATELGAELSMDRTKAYRLLNTLHLHGLVGRDESGGYLLTAKLATLVPARYSALQKASDGPLRALSSATGHSAVLSVADGDTVTALRVIEPDESTLYVSYREGTSHPLDRSASGVVLLARRSGTERADLDLIRAQGYAITRGEMQPGAAVMAVALESSDLEASLAVVTVGELDERQALQALRQAQ